MGTIRMRWPLTLLSESTSLQGRVVFGENKLKKLVVDPTEILDFRIAVKSGEVVGYRVSRVLNASR